MAASRGHVDVVKFLLNCGYPSVDSCNSQSATPLHVAIQSGHLDVIDCLIHAGAQVMLCKNYQNKAFW